MRRSAVLPVVLVPLLAAGAGLTLHVSKGFEVRIRPGTARAAADDDCIGPATLTFTARGHTRFRRFTSTRSSSTPPIPPTCESTTRRCTASSRR